VGFDNTGAEKACCPTAAACTSKRLVSVASVSMTLCPEKQGAAHLWAAPPADATWVSMLRRWIRTHEAGNGLVVVRSGDPRLMQSLEACIRTGAPLLLEGCGEVLDPGLTPLLARRTFKHGE
jgi:hypothetical protein